MCQQGNHCSTDTTEPGRQCSIPHEPMSGSKKEKSIMGQIANQMALELFFKLKQKMKDKKDEKKQNKGDSKVRKAK